MRTKIVLFPAMRAQFAPPAEAKLTAGDPIKSASTLLRNALPVENKPIREVQVRGPGHTQAARGRPAPWPHAGRLAKALTRAEGPGGHQ